MTDRKRTKPKPIHWIFSLYWWNPVIWLIIIVAPIAGIVWGAITGFMDVVDEIIYSVKNSKWT